MPMMFPMSWLLHTLFLGFLIHTDMKQLKSKSNSEMKHKKYFLMQNIKWNW